MNAVRNLLFLLILAVCVGSCGKEKSDYKYYDSIKLKKNLVGESLVLDKDLLLGTIADICILDSFMFIQDYAPKEKCVYKFLLPELKLQASFGSKGKASYEYLCARGLCKINKKVYLWDPIGSKLLNYDIRDSNKIAKVLPIKGGPYSISLFHFISDSLMAQMSLGSKFPLFTIRTGEGLVLDSIFLNEQNMKKGNEFFRLFFASNKSKLVAVSLYGEFLSIYDLESKDYKFIVGPSGFPFDLKRDDKKIKKTKFISGFYDVQIIKNRIYALYSGLTREESEKRNINGANELRIYDMNGTPLYYYHLDTPICAFDVDVNNMILYGIKEDVENFLVRYKLLE